jgi:hypothetical protein
MNYDKNKINEFQESWIDKKMVIKQEENKKRGSNFQ